MNAQLHLLSKHYLSSSIMFFALLFIVTTNLMAHSINENVRKQEHSIQYTEEKTDEGRETDQQEILVVDDTPGNLQFLTSILTGHGYRVRPAANGRSILTTVGLKSYGTMLWSNYTL